MGPPLTPRRAVIKLTVESFLLWLHGCQVCRCESRDELPGILLCQRLFLGSLCLYSRGKPDYDIPLSPREKLLDCRANHILKVLPSSHRGTGNGTAVSCARVMGTVAVVIGSFSDKSSPQPIFVCAALFVVMAIVAAIAPYEPQHSQSV